MGAGDGAREQSEAAARAADALERKASYARARARSFAKGAEGEMRLAEVLASLTVDGWHVLHDRDLPAGGNLDHLLVGRAGIVVLDAKHWSAVVSLAEGVRSGVRVQPSLAQARDAVAEVRAALSGSSLSAPVVGALVFTHEANADRGPEMIGDVLVVGIRHVVSAVLARPAVLSAGQVDATVARVLQVFPGPGSTVRLPQPEREDDAHPLFKKANTYLYVTPWSRGGRHRLYVSGPEGQTYGYKDTVARTVAVTESRMDPVLRGVLANATATSLAFSPENIPKVPTDLPGARILGKLGHMWMTFLVGHRWRKGSMDRLYGWRLNPTDGIDDLGFVDLNTGRLQPMHEKPWGKDLGTPERYLLRLRENFTAGRR